MNRRQRAFLGGITATAALTAALLYAWPYLAPFLLAVFLAAVIDPVVSTLYTRFHIGRGPAVVIVLVLVLAALSSVVFVVVANLTVELEQLLDALPRYALEIRSLVEEFSRRTEVFLARMSPSLAAALRIHPEQWTAAVQVAAKSILAALGALPKALFVLFIGSLATYFISKDRHALWTTVLKTIPLEWRGAVIRFRDEIVGGALGIVRAQFALVGLTAAVSVVGLVLLGVPYAWALGLLAGLLDLAPFLGPSTVFLPLAATSLLQGRPGPGFALLIVWMLIVLGRQLVEPHIFGAGLGLHPVTTLAALYIGVQAVGWAGFIVGPLFLIVAKALFVVTIADVPTGR